jgi:hypothetical protein
MVLNVKGSYRGPFFFLVFPSDSKENIKHVMGSRPGQSVWDLWWTKWHWDRFFSESISFPFQYDSAAVPYSLIHHLGDEQRAR